MSERNDLMMLEGCLREMRKRQRRDRNSSRRRDGLRSSGLVGSRGRRGGG